MKPRSFLSHCSCLSENLLVAHAQQSTFFTSFAFFLLPCLRLAFNCPLFALAFLPTQVLVRPPNAAYFLSAIDCDTACGAQMLECSSRTNRTSFNAKLMSTVRLMVDVSGEHCALHRIATMRTDVCINLRRGGRRLRYGILRAGLRKAGCQRPRVFAEVVS